MKNVIDDGSVVAGAGAFEIAAYLDLLKYKDGVKGRSKLGIEAFARFVHILIQFVFIF